MKLRCRWLAAACALAILSLAACSSSPDFMVVGQDRDGNPIESRYLDAKTVEVKYLKSVYRLTRRTQIPAPFAYLFEKNGNCELLLGDFRIEITSPYQSSAGSAHAAEAR